MNLKDLQTPALILDREKLKRNSQRMTRHLRDQGVNLRPHMKTSKSIDVARVALENNFGGITVASLNEAEYFASHGIRDITYGVCISPDKIDRARDLLDSGVELTVITDSALVAKAIADSTSGRNDDRQLNVLAEIDCGEHRTGIAAQSEQLLTIAKHIDASCGVTFAGVFTHAGHSYGCSSIDEICAVADDERQAVLRAAEYLHENGISCEVRSVGSTPTALHGKSFEGVTEVRAGIYQFNDLFQMEIQSCEMGDIALSVLATVISHDKQRNRLLIDAGGLALSKDRSTAKTQHDYGFGRLLHHSGRDFSQALNVINTHQEHGEVSSEEALPFDELPIGSRVRVLPNHACMTGAMYDRYYIVDGSDEKISAVWPRTNGWEVYRS